MLFTVLAVLPKKKKNSQSASQSFYKYQGCVFATVDMKGHLFQCFDAVGIHGRGAFKVASEVSLKPHGARTLGTCPVVVPPWPQRPLLVSFASFLRRETKPNSLSCVWRRSWQWVKFLNFRNSLPITFKVMIYLCGSKKNTYNIFPFICSQCPLAFWLLITMEPYECYLMESQLVSALWGIFQMKLGCSVTLQCYLEFPKMLPLCPFMPPVLALCLPKYKSYYVFFGGPLDMSITKQISLILRVYLSHMIYNSVCSCA